MVHRRKLISGLAAIAAAPVFVSRAFAANAGTSGQEVLLGQSAVLSGPLGGPMMEFNAGAKLAFDGANRSGGIGGRSIRLVSMDDQLDPARTVDNLKTLLTRDQVFAFFGAVGSATTVASAPILRETNAPLIGNYAVPDNAREATRGAAYYLRATYSREIDRLVELLDVIGDTRIAVVHLANPGGLDMLAHTRTAMKAINPANQLVAAAALSNDGHDAAAAGKLIAAAQPQAVIIFAAGPPVVEFMKAVWDNGSSPLFYGMSIVAGEMVARLLGPKLRNLAVAQVVPFPWAEAEPASVEFRKLRTEAQQRVSYYAYEGWINGLLMVEALKRCGTNLSRDGLHSAMRGMKTRIANLPIDFTGGRQTGSRYVELVAVRPNGKFLR